MPVDSERFSFEVLHEVGPYDSLADDVATGLTRTPRELSPKYFYDERGGELFDAITRTPEYYPTRIEISLLEQHADEIARETEPVEFLEIGSGSPRKARILLPSFLEQGLRRYIPFDINRDAVRRCGEELLAEHPSLMVHGAQGDFTCHFDEIDRTGHRVVAFLGGTIGNFRPDQRLDFLERVREALHEDDTFLLGTDLRPGPAKSRERLEAAYDDEAGLTAEFNRNVLHVINRELDADFAPDGFSHRAPYDDHEHRIEMRLVADENQHVTIRELDLEVEIEAGEFIRTEFSYKFDRETVAAMFDQVDLELENWITDPDELFALSVARTR